MKIQSTKTAINKHLNIMIYGEPGVGKTRFGGLSHIPLVLSAESGLLSIRDQDVDFIEIKEFSDLVEAYHFLAMEKHDYQTVVIDSLTEIQQKCMDAILDGRERAQIADWGTLNNRMKNWVRKLRDLPMNTVITCLAQTIEDQSTMSTKVQPLLQGKIKDEIAAYFDEVFYLFCKKGKDGDVNHYALTHGDERVVAKDRSGKLEMIEKPSFDHIHNKIFGGTNAKKKNR